MQFSGCQIILEWWAMMGKNDGLPTTTMHMLRWKLDGHTSTTHMDIIRVTWVSAVHHCPRQKRHVVYTLSSVVSHMWQAKCT